MKLPELTLADVTNLEMSIDNMNAVLPEMRSFVLPGGHPVVSYCHISRCVCRRAERAVSALAENDAVDNLILVYLNRLSDYLFVLSRKVAQDSGAAEIPWKARL